MAASAEVGRTHRDASTGAARSSSFSCRNAVAAFRLFVFLFHSFVFFCFCFFCLLLFVSVLFDGGRAQLNVSLVIRFARALARACFGLFEEETTRCAHDSGVDYDDVLLLS